MACRPPADRCWSGRSAASRRTGRRRPRCRPSSKSNIPPSQATPARIRTTARPAPTPAMIRRRRRSRSARRAICRSSFSRASLRCRSLLEATESSPSSSVKQCATPHARKSVRVRPEKVVCARPARLLLFTPSTKERLAVLVTGFPAEAFGTNCYVVAAGPGEQALIVDPGIGVLERLDGVLTEHRLFPAAVLLTHGHLDHTFSVAPVCGARGIPAYVHPADLEMLADPQKGLSMNLEQMFGGRAAVQRARGCRRADRRRDDRAGRPRGDRRPRPRPYRRVGAVPAAGRGLVVGRGPALPLRRRPLRRFHRTHRPAGWRAPRRC